MLRLFTSKNTFLNHSQRSREQNNHKMQRNIDGWTEIIANYSKMRKKKNQMKGWRMVKSETRRDAEILVRNLSPRLFGKKFRDSKKVKTNHAKTRLRDWSKMLSRFRDPTKIFRNPRFSRYHSPPLNEIFFKMLEIVYSRTQKHDLVFRRVCANPKHKHILISFLNAVLGFDGKLKETVLGMKTTNKAGQ